MCDLRSAQNKLMQACKSASGLCNGDDACICANVGQVLLRYSTFSEVVLGLHCGGACTGDIMTLQ